jgi:hypothetical protein
MLFSWFGLGHLGRVVGEVLRQQVVEMGRSGAELIAEPPPGRLRCHCRGCRFRCGILRLEGAFGGGGGGGGGGRGPSSK